MVVFSSAVVVVRSRKLPVTHRGGCGGGVLLSSEHIQLSVSFRIVLCHFRWTTTEIPLFRVTLRTTDLFETGEKGLLRSSFRLAARLMKISKPGLPSLETHSILVIRSCHSKALGTAGTRSSQDRRTGVTSSTRDVFEAGEKRLLKSSSKLSAWLAKISKPGLPSLESHSLLVICSWHSKALGFA